MNECIEKILDYIVRVDFYDGSTCTRSVPFGVPNVESMTVTQAVDGSSVNLAANYGNPTLSISIAGGSGIDALMEAPTHKVAEERKPSGIVRNHALSIPVELGYDEVQNVDNALNDKEILCVLTAYDGTKLCVHYLPKSTNISYEDSRGSNHTGTVKFTAQSRSWLVKLASSESSN